MSDGDQFDPENLDLALMAVRASKVGEMGDAQLSEFVRKRAIAASSLEHPPYRSSYVRSFLELDVPEIVDRFESAVRAIRRAKRRVGSMKRSSGAWASDPDRLASHLDDLEEELSRALSVDGGDGADTE